MTRKLLFVALLGFAPAALTACPSDDDETEETDTTETDDTDDTDA